MKTLNNFKFQATLKEHYRTGFASKTVAGSVSTSCSPPYTYTYKPVEVWDRSTIWVTRES